MIVLIHGEDIAKVHNESDKFKTGERFSIDLKKTPIESLVDSLSKSSLFEKKRTFTLSNFSSLHHTKRKKLSDLIKQHKGSDTTNILLIEEKDLTKAAQNALPSDKIIHFPLPKYFFEYLDSLAPGKADHLTTLLQKMTTTEPEQIFYATVKRIRLLLMAKTGKLENFKEGKLPPFVKSKVLSQSQKWTEKELVNFYKKLFKLEIGLKTSSLPLSLGKHLDLDITKL